MDIHSIKNIYFLGIGGIGMSALASYFMEKGCNVYGYDLTSTGITDQLTRQGAVIHFDESPSKIPREIELVVYTPAISRDHEEYRYFEKKGIPILKRSEVLGIISKTLPTIAVAGTHGKTTITAMISHILFPEKKCMAFIGGISKNLHSNFVSDPAPEVLVVEADEYDRSFLSLHPSVAIITSMDADHLDIYDTPQFLEKSFQDFANQLKPGGSLVIHESICSKIEHPRKITYSLNHTADCFATNIHAVPNKVTFDIHYQGVIYKEVSLLVTGNYNIQNALAAFCAVIAGQAEGEKLLAPSFILQKLATFTGVKRRFDYQICRPDLIYIDDYAHHPEEIRSFLTAVRALYPGKKITGIFQPHLYSRTRDFSKEFISSLELLDHVILLDIYPAREIPIPGITSDWLLQQIKKERKTLLSFDTVIPYLKRHKPEILVTIGAGNIDKLVPVLQAEL